MSTRLKRNHGYKTNRPATRIKDPCCDGSEHERIGAAFCEPLGLIRNFATLAHEFFKIQHWRSLASRCCDCYRWPARVSPGNCVKRHNREPQLVCAAQELVVSSKRVKETMR